MSKILELIDEAIAKNELLDIAKLQEEFPEMSAIEAAKLVVHNVIITYARDASRVGIAPEAILWEIIRIVWNLNCPAVLISFEEMLHPSFNPFEIDQDMANWWISQARLKLEQNPDAPDYYKQHWKQIAEGNLPFPFKVKQ